MKFRKLAVSLVAALTAAFALSATPAQATETNDNPCNVQGWYVNPDETADAPTFTEDGFVFEGKDLIHHQTSPIDLPDIKTYTGSFESTSAGKVLFKMETENPYSTIIQNEDGKFWSTAMTYDQDGGQGHPVSQVSDLIGKDTKPGKAKYGETSHVVTFGVGYAIEDGSTTVTSIAFHGTKYDLTCKTTTPSVPPSSSTPPVVVTTSPSAAVTTHPSSSTPPVVGIGNAAGPSLPVTGSNTVAFVIIGLSLLAMGSAGVIYAASRRRRNRFVA